MLSIFLPWLIFARKGKIQSALLCLGLQLSIIGWIPAAIIAYDDAEVDKMKNEVLRRK